jgi:hypothetical protein
LAEAVPVVVVVLVEVVAGVGVVEEAEGLGEVGKTVVEAAGLEMEESGLQVGVGSWEEEEPAAEGSGDPGTGSRARAR